jgi:hypothetical protein
VPDIPRQSIDEIVAKYELHPTLFDIYVEGAFDRDFIFEFLDSTGRRGDVSVYAIDDIEVPAEQVSAFGLSHGSNRNRVLTLAKLLEARLPAMNGNVICLVDADLDRLFGQLRSWAYLAHTDYTCMEMYSLNDSSLKRFLRFTCNLGESTASEFLAIASAVLPVQFCVRGAVEALGLNVSIPAFSSGLTKKKDPSTFSGGKYIEHFLRTNALVDRAEEINTLLADLRSRLTDDIRHHAHGHDFVELLFEFSWLSGGVKLHSKEDDVRKFGSRIVASGVDFAALAIEPLFAALARPSA